MDIFEVCRRLPRPLVMSVSGGETSMFMGRMYQLAHGGTLPDDALFCFQNTGRERPETLKFVERYSIEFGIPITWLEYRRNADGSPSFEVVNYATASRNGEPFDLVIEQRQFLPNPVTRFCTAELKIRTLHRYLRSRGWNEYTNCVGLRYDEPRRVAKMKGRKYDEPGQSVELPLHDAKVIHADIKAFWRDQAFELGLFGHEGNCDLCFLKSKSAIQEILSRKPELGNWWIEKERQIKHSDKARSGTFRNDRPSYGAMQRHSVDQLQFDWDDDDGDEAIDCFCTD